MLDRNLGHLADGEEWSQRPEWVWPSPSPSTLSSPSKETWMVESVERKEEAEMPCLPVLLPHSPLGNVGCSPALATQLSTWTLRRWVPRGRLQDKHGVKEQKVGIWNRGIISSLGSQTHCVIIDCAAFFNIVAKYT